jgi:hypothetical protein
MKAEQTAMLRLAEVLIERAKYWIEESELASSSIDDVAFKLEVLGIDLATARENLEGDTPINTDKTFDAYYRRKQRILAETIQDITMAFGM